MWHFKFSTIQSLSCLQSRPWPQCHVCFFAFIDAISHGPAHIRLPLESYTISPVQVDYMPLRAPINSIFISSTALWLRRIARLAPDDREIVWFLNSRSTHSPKWLVILHSTQQATQLLFRGFEFQRFSIKYWKIQDSEVSTSKKSAECP